jgi:hypothetical protein
MTGPTITFWQNLLETKNGSEWTPGGWDPVFARLSETKPFRGAQEHPGWSAARFEGQQRGLEFVREVFALCLDFDKGETIRGVRQRLAGFFGIIHTTRRHTAEAPRFRVVLPLSRPVTADEYTALWIRFANWAGSVDQAPKDPSRFWFLPGVTDGGPFDAHRLTGEAIDVDEWLSRPDPTPKPVVVQSRQEPRRDAGSGDREARALAYLRRIDGAISGQDGSGQTWGAAIALARGFGLNESQTFSLLWSEHNPRCDPPWTEKELRHKARQAQNARVPLDYLYSAVLERDRSGRSYDNDRGMVQEQELPPEPAYVREPGDDTEEIQQEPTPKPLMATETMRQILTASRIDAFSNDPIDFLTTTHYRLDDITGGIRAPDNWVIAADTSFGKTSWLIAIADDNIRHRKKRVLIVSTEDSNKRFGGRFMVRRSGVDAKRYRNRKLTREEMAKVLDTEAAGEETPTYVDVRGREVEDLVPELLRVIDGEAIDLIAFDYLQEFTTKKRYQDERVKFKEIAARLRGVGKQAKRPIPSIILSQLTLNEKTGIPTRQNIRECKDVANAADAIMIGFEPEQDIKDREGLVLVEEGTKFIYVDKIKDGERKGKVPMRWNAKCACFETVADPEEERFRNAGGDEFDRYGDN